jgi:hypothetical protein
MAGLYVAQSEYRLLCQVAYRCSILGMNKYLSFYYRVQIGIINNPVFCSMSSGGCFL